MITCIKWRLRCGTPPAAVLTVLAGVGLPEHVDDLAEDVVLVPPLVLHLRQLEEVAASFFRGRRVEAVEDVGAPNQQLGLAVIKFNPLYL